MGASNSYLSFLLVPLVMFASWIVQAWLGGRFKVSIPDNVRPAAELAVHIISGSVLFALVFSSAAAINFLIEWFADHGISPKWLVPPTHVLEAIIWAGDTAGFLLFMAVQLVLFGRQMFQALKSPEAH